MLKFFSFEGRIWRSEFALWSLGIYLSQYAVIAAVFGPRYVLTQLQQMDWRFSTVPLRSLWASEALGIALILVVSAFILIANWALTALAFRRARDADASEWIAALAIAPVVQIAAIFYLCIVPTRGSTDHTPVVDNRPTPSTNWQQAAQGVIAGVALTLLAVAVGALLFGSYGYGIFVVTPFVVGLMTAYFANRKIDMGASRTTKLTLIATLLGGIALIAVALEGLVCILLAAPIGVGLAAVGGLLGRAVALHSRRPPQQALSAVLLLPLVFALENAFPTSVHFETQQAVTIDASSEVVWKTIVTMPTIDERPALPFRLGMAYPLRGEVIGEGIGALRRGEFSTGTALERITEWLPYRKLAFEVVEDVPAMHELSPYPHVHAPHVMGYFRTIQTRFDLSDREGSH